MRALSLHSMRRAVRPTVLHALHSQLGHLSNGIVADGGVEPGETSDHDAAACMHACRQAGRQAGA